MDAREVPRAEWPAFLGQFSRTHRAWLAAIDAAPGAGHRAGSALPLEDVQLERRGDREAITIRFQDRPFEPALRIDDPAAIRIERTPAGTVHAVVIEDGRGARTTLQFRTAPPAELLDGLAPGEAPGGDPSG